MASVDKVLDEGSLYAAAPRIYPRHVTGRFARLRWVMVWITQLIFYGLPWLSWNGRQAVLFDIAARRFHIFGLVLWPQDFIMLTGLLICSALALFLFTAVAGRLWCGYACPQTVYTSLFLWIERRTEGEWAARRRRDEGPWNADKLLRKLAKHGAWAVLAAWTGVSFVGYFTPIKSLLPALTSFSVGPWEGFWVAFYGFATYGNAGWMREQVCKYMCPYARFQGVMMDADTLTVTYDALRGEPRGGRSRGLDARAARLGACVDCHLCVQVCPTGIDIRQGLQIDCINCGLCVDACNSMMDRFSYARGLISYTSTHLLDSKARVCPETECGFKDCKRNEEDPGKVGVAHRRVAIYGSLLVLVGGALIADISLRSPVRLDVMRDRSVLSRETPDGQVENIYRLQLLNMSEHERTFDVSVSGAPGLHLAAGGHSSSVVPALGTAQLAVDVDAEPATLPHHRTTITLEVRARDDPKVRAHSETQFFSP